MSGWVKIWRQMERNPDLRAFDARGLFVTLLLRAARERKTTRYRNVTITLERGQLAISIRELADLGETSYKRVRGILKTLEQGRTVSIEPGARFSLITVCNYEQYQKMVPEQGALDLPAGAQRGRTRGHTQGAVNLPAGAQSQAALSLEETTENKAAENSRGALKSPTRAQEGRTRGHTEQEEEEGKKKDSDTDVSGPPAGGPPDGEKIDLRKEIFGSCLTWLTENTDKPSAKLRPILGKWCRDFGDDVVLTTLHRAARDGPVEPISWITATLKGGGQQYDPTTFDFSRFDQ